MTTPLTRRDFLQMTTIATAGLTLASPGFARSKAEHSPLPSPTPRRTARSLSTLRVGLVGCGGRGTGAAMQALAADPDVVLWSVADAFVDRIDPCLRNLGEALADGDDELGQRVQVPRERRFVGLTSHQALLESGVDVVLLCTPPVFRPRQLADAVAAGKHVFCEKPVAVDAPGVRSVLESARRAQEARLAIVSGFCWRYSTRERETYRRILQERAIGDVVAAYTTYNTTGWIEPKPRQPHWSDMEFQLRNWHYFHWLSGDHIVEQAVHAIDKLHWAMGGRLPRRVTAVGGRQTRPNVPETGNVYDHFAVTYEYDDGVKAFHMCRHWPNSPSDNADYLIGAEGCAHINGWTHTHVISGARPWRCETPANDMYQTEHDELFASIRSGSPINDGVQMSESTLMAIAGRMAAYTGAVVTWEEALNSQESLEPPSWELGDRPTPPVAVPGTTKFR